MGGLFRHLHLCKKSKQSFSISNDCSAFLAGFARELLKVVELICMEELGGSSIILPEITTCILLSVRHDIYR